MTWLDHFLERRRIAHALPFLRPGARVLDIGCGDGTLFQTVNFLGVGCLGIDPRLRQPVSGEGFELLPGFFPRDMPAVGPFDAVTMLAVLEHFPTEELARLTEGCRQFLKHGGKVIITVPSAQVDWILAVLQKLGFVHGMALDEHHGYEVRRTAEIFARHTFDCSATGHSSLD